MAEKKKKDLFSKLFGARKSCCCNMRIEEAAEEQQKKPTGQTQAPSCCGNSKAQREPK